MIDNSKPNTVCIVDNGDIDNPLAARLGCDPRLGLDFKAVIVTGRPAHPSRSAPIGEHDPIYSKGVLRLNTRRMKGYLRRRGFDKPVFQGLIPPRTVVPHRIHVDEVLLDLYNDRLYTQDDGAFPEALTCLDELEGVIDFVIGGPLTEAREIKRDPRLEGRLGTITCQLGLFGFSGVTNMAGKGLTFNNAADRDATEAVLAEWPGDVYMVPTDVSKLPAVGFDDPAKLWEFGITGETLRLYEIFYREAALEARGERIYPYDVHAAFLMAQLRGTLGHQLYTWEEVRINGVGANGEIDATFGQTVTDRPKRFVVKDVEAELFLELLGDIVR